MIEFRFTEEKNFIQKYLILQNKDHINKMKLKIKSSVLMTLSGSHRIFFYFFFFFQYRQTIKKINIQNKWSTNLCIRWIHLNMWLIFINIHNAGFTSNSLTKTWKFIYHHHHLNLMSLMAQTDRNLISNDNQYTIF